MATVYYNNSSRRFPELPHEEMQEKWNESLGAPKGSVCNRCSNKSDDGRLINGLCRKCRTENHVPDFTGHLSNELVGDLIDDQEEYATDTNTDVDEH
jgi:hypothetical protein